MSPRRPRRIRRISSSVRSPKTRTSLCRAFCPRQMHKSTTKFLRCRKRGSGHGRHGLSTPWGISSFWGMSKRRNICTRRNTVRAIQNCYVGCSSTLIILRQRGCINWRPVDRYPVGSGRQSRRGKYCSATTQGRLARGQRPIVRCVNDRPGEGGKLRIYADK